jgi:hypothetical protein
LAIFHQLVTTLQFTQHIHYLTVLLPQLTLERMLLLKLVAVSIVALLTTIVLLEQDQLLVKVPVLKEVVMFFQTQLFLQVDLFLQVRFGVVVQLNSLDT